MELPPGNSQPLLLDEIGSLRADAHIDAASNREREECAAFAAGEAASDREYVAVKAIVYGVGADRGAQMQLRRLCLRDEGATLDERQCPADRARERWARRAEDLSAFDVSCLVEREHDFRIAGRAERRAAPDGISARCLRKPARERRREIRS